MSIYLQKINYSDQNLINKLLELRNEEETRNNSLNTNIITPEIFQNIILKYKESNIDPFIIYQNEIPIGIISFVKNNDEIFIGINIDKNYRNKGIGNLALELTIKELKNTKIIAKIKKNNTNSIKLFSKYFKYHKECSQFIEYIHSS